MKKIIFLALFLASVLSFFACGNDFTYSPFPLEESEAEKDALTGSPSEAVIVQLWSGNSNYEVSEGRDTTCSFPQIQIDSTYARSVNAEILALYEAELYMNGGQGSFVSVNYAYTITGDMLSLVIQGYPHYSTDGVYRVYNIDLQTGEAVSKDTLCSYFALSAEEYTGLCRSSVRTYFTSRFSKYSSGEETVIEKKLQESISDENIANAVPYVDSDQRLSWLVKIYNPAGGEFHEALLTSNVFIASSP